MEGILAGVIMSILLCSVLLLPLICWYLVTEKSKKKRQEQSDILPKATGMKNEFYLYKDCEAEPNEGILIGLDSGKLHIRFFSNGRYEGNPSSGGEIREQLHDTSYEYVLERCKKFSPRVKLVDEAAYTQCLRQLGWADPRK